MATVIATSAKAEVVKVSARQLELLALLGQSTVTATVVKSNVNVKTGRGVVTTFTKGTLDSLIKLGLARTETVTDRKNVESVVAKAVDGVLLAK